MKLVVTGDNYLKGDVYIHGSKNSALPIIAASILAKGVVTLKNIPRITDVFDMLKILDYLKVKYTFDNDILFIDSTNIEYSDLLNKEVSKIRASYYFIGSLLSVFNKVKITSPGGCNIGSRPIDLHILVLKSLGAIPKQNKKSLSIKIDEYNNSIFTFPRKSVGATINALLASVGSNKITKLINIALEPEVIDVINFLKALGANIIIKKNKYIIYPSSLKKELEYKIIPDRIEAATYITMGLLAGEIKVNSLNKKHLVDILKPLKKNKANLIIKKDYVIAKKSRLNAFDIMTKEYPGFPTDAQPLIFVLMALSKGEGLVIDSIFEQRFKACEMLNILGANIIVNEDKALYQGVEELIGNTVTATDLRCAASLLLAALVAKGETVINKIEFIDRGYTDIYQTVLNLGGDLKLVEDTN